MDPGWFSSPIYEVFEFHKLGLRVVLERLGLHPLVRDSFCPMRFNSSFADINDQLSDLVEFGGDGNGCRTMCGLLVGLSF